MNDRVMSRSRFWRIVRRGVVTFLVVFFVAAVGGYFWLRTSLPPDNAAVSSASLRASAEAVVDEHGIPHIFAENSHDAAFALGVLHAQDRLWQMEMQRRLASGRLSEVFGADTVKIDRYMRTLGLHRAAEEALAGFAEDTLSVLFAYAAGVNAWMDQRPGLLPPEFILFGHRPEPWSPADSVVWGKLMALRLSGNYRDELLRRQMLELGLTEDQLRTLWPDYPADAPITGVSRQARLAPSAISVQVDPRVANLNGFLAPETYDRSGVIRSGGNASRYHQIGSRSSLLNLLHAVTGTVHGATAQASNAWAVSGAMTRSGKPLLANDPHLGFSAPILWYLARVSTPEGGVAGATVPGAPFHLLGHNGRVAWGITTTQSDLQDVFVEPEGAVTATRSETIQVRGGKPVVHEVRETRHGPVISDLAGMGGGGGTLALRATFLGGEDLTAQAVFRINQARDVRSFSEALRDLHAPQLNVTYADVDGQIGFFSAGRTPIRGRGAGLLPTDGAHESDGWQGWIPFDELPRVLDPPEGYVANANNRVTPPDYPHFISADWAAPYRIRRIVELLDGGRGLEVPDMARIQADTVSLAARDLVPLMTDWRAGAETGEHVKTALALLRAWGGEMAVDRPEPLIFHRWLRALNRALFADELGATFDGYQGLHPLAVFNILRDAHPWCDDSRTAERETCHDALRSSLRTALNELSEATGDDDPNNWRWGDHHQARFRHQALTRLPVLGRFADLSTPSPGGDFTVNRGTTRPAHVTAPHDHIHGAGYRAIYDLAALENSQFIIATGQSGNPLSNHYADFLPRWSEWRYVTIDGSREFLRASAARVVKFVPIRDDRDN